MKPLSRIHSSKWQVGCGVLALFFVASNAFGQAAYDPYANARARSSTSDSDYTSGERLQLDSNGNPIPNSTDRTVAPPRHRTDSPRAGSREYGASIQDNNPNAGAKPQASSPTPTQTKRNYRGNATRSSYEQRDSRTPKTLRMHGRRIETRRPQGIIDSATAQFSTPAPSADSSYGYRPRHVRMAMADQEIMPSPAGSGQSTSSVITQPTDQSGSMHSGSIQSGPMQQGRPLAHGDMNMNMEMDDEGMQPEYGPNDGGGCESCGRRGRCGRCGNDCGSCCCGPLCRLLCIDCWWNDDWVNDLTVFTGVQGFKGPVDQGVNGDFGFHEGLNWGTPVWDAVGLGAQVGFAADHSDLSRTNATDMHRNQYFFTAGLFHRPQCNCGWQGGLVFDYLNDSFVDNFTVSQIRGDVSYVFNCHEIGFWYTHGVHDATFITTTEGAAVTTTTTEYHPVDLYAFYYGHRYCNGGEGRIWGGFTGGVGAMIGADFSVPLHDRVTLETGFNYVIPRTVSTASIPPESWNLGINLVWHAGCCAHESYSSPYRPLFNVADNGSFMVNREVRQSVRGKTQEPGGAGFARRIEKASGLRLIRGPMPGRTLAARATHGSPKPQRSQS